MKSAAWRLAPGGLEFTLTAGRLAGLDPAARVVEAGCGMGLTAVELAQHFGCQIEAFDLYPDFIHRAEELAHSHGVAAQTRFYCTNILQAQLDPSSYDLALADGGVLTAVTDREALLRQLYHALKQDAHLYLTDLVVHPWAPESVTAYYQQLRTGSEQLYRRLLPRLGFELTFVALLPPSAWQHYFYQMNQAARQRLGFLKTAEAIAQIHQEATLYYREGGRGSLDYLFILARKVGLKE